MSIKEILGKMLGVPFINTNREGVYITHMSGVKLSTLYDFNERLESKSFKPVIRVYPHTKDLLKVEVSI